MKKPELTAAVVAALCIASVATLLSWPQLEGGTWRTASPPAWWQLDWLAGIGVVLSALPSLAVSALDNAFRMAPGLRNAFAGALILLEVVLLCLVTYKVAQRVLASAAMAQQTAARDRAKSAAREQ
jgi:hypothetical protein